ncbi:MAG: DNA polymerase I [Actinomycetaceae bacterium]|nr:DNA polymerase I [Actinomycetaceae bacterium]
MSENRLLVLDGHSMAFRAFFALPVESFSTSTGQSTNAVYGFITMLLKMIDEHQPTHIAAAFDASRYSFRTDEYPEYKAGRDATPEEFKGQVPLIKQVLDAMGIVSITKDGFEADDILATLAKAGEEHGMSVLLASGDRDTFQLITDHTHVLYPGRSTSDLRQMDAHAVEERYGVPPQRYPHLAALTGEKADNLPGVPGVGEKTAAQWIVKYDGLEGVLANADKIGGKRGEALREHIDDVKRNRKLNELLTTVPLEVTVDDLERVPIDRNALEELFDTLEFNTLRERVFKADVGEPEPEPEVSTEIVIERADDISVGQWLKAHDGHTGVTVTPAGSDIDLIILYVPGHALVLDPRELSSDDEAALTDFLTSSPTLIAHDAKGARHLLKKRGMGLAEPVFDTELAAYLCRPDQRDFSIGALARRYLDRTVSLDDEGGQMSLIVDDTASVALAQAQYDLVAPLRSELESRGALGLLTKLEIPVQTELWHMEDCGIAADMTVLEDLSTELAKAVESAKQAAYDVIGHEVNLSSPKQLQEVLFDELNMPKTKRTKTGYTTNADALNDLLAKTGHPFLTHLLDHRDKIKMQQTVDGLIKAVESDGHIHTTFKQTITATGRLSSVDPNLQNIPARTAEGLRVREAFVPGHGFDNLLTADYSQIEMRIMAHMSDDEALIDAFNSGEDLHRTMAAMVFHVPVEQVDSQLRGRIKATSYGLAYGLSSYGLSQQLGIPVPEARQLREQYFERFGGVQRFLNSVVEEARRRGYTETLMGRRRYIPDLNSANRQRRSMAERAALNAPIQGSAADIIKVAMVNVAQKLREKELKSRVLLQVHDELVLEIIDAEEDTVKEIMADCMAKAATLDVPLDISMGVGKSWRSAAH